MLEIKLRRLPDGTCPVCEGSGIVIPKNAEMPVRVGSFCPACEEGVRRWQEMAKAASAIEQELAPGSEPIDFDLSI